MNAIRTATFALLIGGAMASAGCSPDSLPTGQVEKLKAEIAKLETENARLESDNVALKSGNAELRAKLAVKPAMPVNVTFRKARLAQGYVAVFSTTVKDTVPVLVTHRSTQLGTTNRIEVYVDPEIPTEIGGMDGVVFQPGDQVLVENRNYETVRTVVEPRNSN